MKKRSPWVVPAGALCYLGLLLLLTLAESGAPDATIRTPVDALWYSLVTMTTVGYGDLYPVTAVGRAIGGVFLLMSLGVLVLLLSLAASLLSGRLVPRLRLAAGRRLPWYVFPDRSPGALALAKNLAGQPDGKLLIFTDAPGPVPETLPAAQTLCMSCTVEELVRWRGGSSGLSFFALGADSLQNQLRAERAAPLAQRVYCRSELAEEETSGNITLFSRIQSCARLYWQERPAAEGERTVVLIGAGRYGRRLLEQALLTNVMPGRRFLYHVFGDGGEFLRCHTQLEQFLDVDRDTGERDAVFFHRESWNGDQTLLERADRILLCSDSEEENLERLHTLLRCYAVLCPVDVLTGQPLPAVPGLRPFGGDESLFTPELVMRRELDRAAAAMHEIYCADVDGAPAWEELTSFQRQSNLAAADHLPVKTAALLGGTPPAALMPELCARACAAFQALSDEEREVCRRVEHERWCRFHYLRNWKYDPTRDNARRRHPLLLPYEQLTPEEQRKDDFAWEMLGKLSEHLQGEKAARSPGQV